MEMTSYPPGTPSWVDLGSPDPGASSEFYSTVFGWEVVAGTEDTGGYRMCLLRGKPVAGIGSQQAEGRPYWTTYVSVADADQVAAAVRDAGGQVVVEPMNVLDHGRMAVFTDPAGAAFSIWQPVGHIGAGLVNEPGALCWNELTTREPDRARTFYRSVFGWDANAQQMGPVVYTEWKLGERTVGGMMPMDENWPAEIPSHWMVYFAVADTDATVEQVNSLGGTTMVPPTDIPPGRFAVLNDPQGAVFSVIAIAAG